jgi:hypothetical protein
MPKYTVTAYYEFEYEIEADNQTHAEQIALYTDFENIDKEFYVGMSSSAELSE